MGYTHPQTEGHLFPAIHYLVRGVSNTCLTSHVEISIVQQRALLVIRVSACSGRRWTLALTEPPWRVLPNPPAPATVSDSADSLLKVYSLLKVCLASMKAQNAQEDILIVRAACHPRGEVDVRRYE